PLFRCNHTATPEISTLSLHDALPISNGGEPVAENWPPRQEGPIASADAGRLLVLCRRSSLKSRRQDWPRYNSVCVNCNHAAILRPVFSLTMLGSGSAGNSALVATDHC